MDGSKERFSALPLGGTTLENMASLERSEAVIGVGKSMEKAGGALGKRFGIPFYSVPVPIGIDASDEFIKTLVSISGAHPPERIMRWRKRLVDGMVDTHLVTGGRKTAIGLDRELVLAIAGLCTELGVEVKAAASDCAGDDGISTGSDLEDMEDAASEGVDLVISNSHGKETSIRLNAPLLKMGFPVVDSFGETMKLRAGYRGTLNLLFEMANVFQSTIDYSKQM